MYKLAQMSVCVHIYICTCTNYLYNLLYFNYHFRTVYSNTMVLKTKLTEALGIKHPVVQGGMVSVCL